MIFFTITEIITIGLNYINNYIHFEIEKIIVQGFYL